MQLPWERPRVTFEMPWAGGYINFQVGMRVHSAMGLQIGLMGGDQICHTRSSYLTLTAISTLNGCRVLSHTGRTARRLGSFYTTWRSVRLAGISPQRNRADGRICTGVNIVILPKLVDRLHPSQGLQSNLRIEFRRMHCALLRFAHFFYFPMTAYRLNCCLESGVHYKLR